VLQAQKIAEINKNQQKKYANFFAIKEICSTFAPLFAISGKKFRRESIRVACEYCVELIQKIKEN